MIIVSNDRANATAARLGRGVVTVVPVTSNVTRVFLSRCSCQPKTRGTGWIRRPKPSKSAPSQSGGSDR